MNTALEKINMQVIPAIALDSAEEGYQSTIKDSVFGRFSDALVRVITANTAKLSFAGNFLQIAGFSLVALMFFIVAAPQFANDKEALALIVAAAMGLRVLGRLLNGKEHYKPSAVDGLVLLYFGINVIASFASHYLPQSIHGLAKVSVYLVAYFLFVDALQHNPKQRTLIVLGAMLFGALLVSVYGLDQYRRGVAPLATWEDPTVEDKTTRVFSTLGNPNLLAGYLIPIVPFGFCLSAIALMSKGWKRWLTLPLIGSTFIITVATFLTGSRGGWLALIAQGAVLFVVAFAWLWKGYPRTRIPLLLSVVLLPIAAVLAIHFFLPSQEHRFLSIFSGSEHSSNAYRIHVYIASFNMFKDNWWIGIGTGNKTFEQAYGLYMRSGFDALGTYCVPLEVAVETGIPGLLSFGWLLLAVAARGHRRFWGSSDIVVQMLSLGAMAAIIGMMAHGLFDTVFYRPQVQFIFWLTVAILVVLPTNPAAEATQSQDELA